MVLDRAPQHKADVMAAVKEMGNQVILVYLPPGCPHLNTIEELWRQMKMSVLNGPYTKMHNDIDS